MFVVNLRKFPQRVHEISLKKKMGWMEEELNIMPVAMGVICAEA